MPRTNPIETRRTVRRRQQRELLKKHREAEAKAKTETKTDAK